MRHVYHLHLAEGQGQIIIKCQFLSLALVRFGDNAGLIREMQHSHREKYLCFQGCG